MPYFYEKEDRDFVRALTFANGQAGRPTILFHAINHSHLSLSLFDLFSILDRLASAGSLVSCNISQGTGHYASVIREKFSCIDVPGYLLPLVQSRYAVVGGVLGDAIAVAQSFCSSVVAYILTDYIHPSACITDPAVTLRGIGYDFFPVTLRGPSDYFVHPESKGWPVDIATSSSFAENYAQSVLRLLDPKLKSKAD